MNQMFVVALGAGIGGVFRLLVTQLVATRFGASVSFLATIFINVSGSFLIGAVLETAQLRANIDPLWRSFLATGILGGFTTFSTFSYEALGLASSATPTMAAYYVVASVGLGIIGSFAGIATARTLLR